MYKNKKTRLSEFSPQPRGTPKGDYENSLFEPCSVISYGNQLRYFYYKQIDFFCQEWRRTKMNKKGQIL